MVEGACLENRFARECNGGSNPSLTADAIPPDPLAPQALFFYLDGVDRGEGSGSLVFVFSLVNCYILKLP